MQYKISGVLESPVEYNCVIFINHLDIKMTLYDGFLGYYKTC